MLTKQVEGLTANSQRSIVKKACCLLTDKLETLLAQLERKQPGKWGTDFDRW